MSLKQRIIIPTSIAIVIIIVLVINVMSSKYHYKLSTEEILEKAVKYDDVVKPADAVTFMQQPDKYRFIDLRAPQEFIKGHIPNAINIPVHQLLSDEYQKMLDSKDVINILYHNNHIGACSPWMLMTQIGYENNKILIGGYTYFKQFALDTINPEGGNYRDELPLYDFAQKIQELKGGADSTATPVTTTTTAPLPVKTQKKKSSGGGC